MTTKDKIVNRIMKRYLDDDKRTLWEEDFHNNGIYTGTVGVYQSPDGRCFYARYHSNQLSYTGQSYLRVVPTEAAFKSLTAKFPTGNGDEEINPELYLITERWIY